MENKNIENTHRGNLIIIFGPPGSGKSTQSVLLEEKMGYKYVSWGRITRNIMNGKFGSEDDRRTVLNNINNNFSYPEKYIKKNILQNLIQELEAGNTNFVIDGFPKRTQEAKECIEIIKELDLHLQCVINIACIEATMLKRIESRKYCQECGRFFNDILRPKNEGVCDFDQGKLIRRIDDEPKVVKERINEYLNDITPAIQLLSSMSESFFSINGDQDELLMFADIITKLKVHKKDIFSLFKNVGHTLLPTKFGYFDMYVYQNIISYESHVVLTCGDITNKQSVPVRIHSSCVTGDIFHSEKCDCGSQLTQAMSFIQKNGQGIIMYLFQEGRGINLINKIKAYDLQQKGFDTIEANEFLGIPSELRSYEVARDVLKDLNVRLIRLITNNPDKISQVLDLGINIDDTISLKSDHFVFNEDYLKTKVDRMMHNKDLINQKNNNLIHPTGQYLEIEKKYLLTKLEVDLLEKKCIELGLSLISHVYEKNQNFDRDNIFEKDDARLRLRTKIADMNEQEKSFEFTYKKRLNTDNGIKKETELNYNFSSVQSSENLLDLFKIIGLVEKDSYERMRKTFKNDEIQITIDEFPFGYIVEIEGDEEMVVKYDNILNMNNFVQYSLSCDDVYAELCKKKGVKPKTHILFGDRDMPKLEKYIKTWKK
ncbi:nucleoside monophosphate kinase [Candidatus Nomurabacteria bacterium]|nr:nucleoside monophosphate kinase [Candidatus Nomurabacteria bacterium]